MATGDILLRVKNLTAGELARMSADFATLTKAEQAAGREGLRLAQSEAAIKSASGDAAGAVRVLSGAIDQARVDAGQYSSAAKQLVNANNAVERSSRSAASGAAVLPRTIAGLSHEAATWATGLLSVGVALRAISTGAELVQLGARAELTRTRFNQLGISIADLRKASGGTIGDTALELDAMKASTFRVARSAQELATLLAIARDRAQQFGISTESAFDSLVTGLGRGSKLILDNIGVMVNESVVNEAYAKSVGKTVDALTDQEKKQALINEVLRQGHETIAKTGGAVDGQAGKLERMGASWTNVKEKIGSFLGEAVGPQIEGLSATVNWLDNLGAAQVREIGLLDAVSAATLRAAQATAQHTNAINDDINAAILHTQLMQQQVPIQLGYADALERGGRQARAAAMAAEQKGIADRVAAVDAQTHTIAEQALAHQAQEAANRLLNSGIQGANAAATLAQSSQGVDVMTAAFYRLGAAQAAAGRGGAAAGVGGSAAGTTAAAAADAAKARSAQVLAIGTHNQKLIELNRLLQAAIRQHGRGSAEAIGAETSLIQERNNVAKGHTSELGKQLTLNEGIYDSQQKILDAQLRGEELAIRNRQETRKEDQELRIATNAATNARDPRLRAAAQDAIALIDVHRRQRANELGQQAATAGGSIVGGKLFQSVGGGAPAIGGRPPGVGGTPGATGGAPTATFVLSADGKVLGSVVLPYVIGALMEGHLQGNNGGGGRVSP